MRLLSSTVHSSRLSLSCCTKMAKAKDGENFDNGGGREQSLHSGCHETDQSDQRGVKFIWESSLNMYAALDVNLINFTPALQLRGELIGLISLDIPNPRGITESFKNWSLFEPYCDAHS